jgi:hypothetical protein
MADRRAARKWSEWPQRRSKIAPAFDTTVAAIKSPTGCAATTLPPAIA